jgi:hypothetical protein
MRGNGRRAAAREEPLINCSDLPLQVRASGKLKGSTLLVLPSVIGFGVSSIRHLMLWPTPSLVACVEHSTSWQHSNQDLNSMCWTTCRRVSS